MVQFGICQWHHDKNMKTNFFSLQKIELKSIILTIISKKKKMNVIPPIATDIESVRNFIQTTDNINKEIVPFIFYFFNFPKKIFFYIFLNFIEIFLQRVPFFFILLTIFILFVSFIILFVFF